MKIVNSTSAPTEVIPSHDTPSLSQKSYSLAIIENGYERTGSEEFNSLTELQYGLLKHFVTVSDNSGVVSHILEILKLNTDLKEVKIDLNNKQVYFIDNEGKLLNETEYEGKNTTTSLVLFEKHIAIRVLDNQSEEPNEFEVIDQNEAPKATTSKSDSPDVEIITNIPVKSYKYIAPPKREISNYSDKIKEYIENTLLPEVNRAGTAPLLLRPLAALLALFGIHGFGQTNCLSCATAVAETLRDRKTYVALPELRGAKPENFLSLSGNGYVFQNVDRLADNIQTSKNINNVLLITRPWYRQIFSPADGHACNIFKEDNTVYLIDSQKNINHIIKLLPDSTEAKKQLVSALTDFIGAVATDETSLKLFEVGFKTP
jgi:Papain fold toxin 1, glutamine deamidase